MSDHAAIATHALGLGSQPWNDPASRKRGTLQYELRELERRHRDARRMAGDLAERIKAVKAAMEAL